MESGKKGENNERNNTSRRFGNSFITAYSGDVKATITSVCEYSGQFYAAIPEVGNRRSDIKETYIPEP